MQGTAEDNLLFSHILEETEIVSPRILLVAENNLHFPFIPAMEGDGFNFPHILGMTQHILNFCIYYKAINRICLFSMS
jgi:hypothetical protein